ncbi:MAG TPA: Flp family type IVb pilin [Alphaproteobacteria bacterium]
MNGGKAVIRNNFFRILRRIGESRDGATAIEYGLICALIALVIVGSVTMVGTEMTTTYDSIASAVSSVSN